MAPKSKQGVNGERVSNTSVTQQVQIIGDKVFYALAIAMTNGHWHKESFGKDFFKRSGFISENYAHSLHGFIVITWDAFPAAVCSSFREHGCDSHSFLLLTLQSWVTLPMRETQPCCLAGRSFPSILPWYGARCESKANHCPSPHNTYPPICGAAGNKDRYPATPPELLFQSPRQVGRSHASTLLTAATDTTR